ncbi:hypothetical protein [Vibrio chagasii]|uniref:hypothetical protein n=1 Tax=Vibrio chagasii TaxID=170679 RepID=UPI0021C40960|nr:hypothetical protein [Vibrio chagasii]
MNKGPSLLAALGSGVLTPIIRCFTSEFGRQAANQRVASDGIVAWRWKVAAVLEHMGVIGLGKWKIRRRFRIDHTGSKVRPSGGRTCAAVERQQRPWPGDNAGHSKQ